MNRGAALRLSGQARLAVSACQEALAELDTEPAAAAEHVAAAHRNLGVCLCQLGDLSSGTEELRRALEQYRQAGLRYGIALTHGDLSVALSLAGNQAASEWHNQEALSHWLEIGHPGNIANALNSQGVSQHMRGEYEAALATYERALDYARRGASRRLQAFIWAGKGDVYREMSRWPLAMQAYEQAQPLAEALRDPGLLCYLRTMKAEVHRGKGESDVVDDALRELAARLAPELVIATGDHASLGRSAELERSRDLLASLGAPLLAVPGNHDIPYTFPGRFTHPWRSFERIFGEAEPVVRTPHAVGLGLNSVRPWGQQGGRLRESSLALLDRAFRDAPSGALRLVAFHHHLAWAPWRGLHKLPLRHRDRVLGRLAAAGVELVCCGHIHQSTAVERREIVALDGPVGGPLVLTTAPGYGRPRPRRTGEAHGLHVLEWTEGTLVVETRVWDGAAFTATARRAFSRASTL